MDLDIVRRLTRFQKAKTSYFLMKIIGVPFGTQSVPINVENFKKSIFYNTRIRHNGTQNGTPVVPKISNGTQVVPQLLDTLYKKINFHDFSSSKNGHITTLGTILGTIPNFWVPSIIFLESIPCQPSEKQKKVVVSQNVLTQLHFYDFLPNPEFSIVRQNVLSGYHRIFYGTQIFDHRKE